MKALLKYMTLIGALWAASLTAHAQAQPPIRIGELNSYKVLPALMGPYRKGWELT